MTLFRKLRSSLHHKLLQRKLSKTNYQRQAANFERARKIGVLVDVTLPDNLRTAKKFNQQLASMSKRADFFAYTNHSKPAESIPFPYMTHEHVSWLFIPNHPLVEDYLTKHYDLLINLCTEECLPLEYISALSNASFRVGRFIADKTYCFDLMINLNGKNDMDYLIEQMEVYLKMIK